MANEFFFKLDAQQYTFITVFICTFLLLPGWSLVASVSIPMTSRGIREVLTREREREPQSSKNEPNPNPGSFLSIVLINPIPAKLSVSYLHCPALD